MRSVWLYRIVAGILLLFAMGHTAGFLSFRPSTVEGRAVWDAMNHSLLRDGEPFTYGRFYTAFGLDLTLYMLFSAFLAWHLSVMARRAPTTVVSLSWAFVLLQVGGLVLALIYFAAVQVIPGAVVALLLTWATASLPKSPPVSQ